METATSERLLQYSSLAAQGLEGPDHNWASISRYEAISSAANVSLNIREAHPSSLDLSIEEKYINYDGDDTRMGTFSKPAYKPTRVYVEILRRFRYTSTEDDDPSRKDTLNRMKELCVLLKEPRSFGFTTMTCLGIITNFADFDGGDIKLVYELPAAADPLERPVSLHDLLTLDDHRSKEPPDVDARFSLATKLANALHEMHSTGWLHRDVSSKNIHFFRGKDISSCNTYDIERPYIAGFDAARSFTANRSLAWYQWDFDAGLHQHPGYLLEKFWAQRHAERGNTGDKLFYMPRHDYYSIGLILLQIGMWKDLYSLWPSNIPLIPLNPTPESSETTPGEKSENLTLNMWFARLEFLDELNPGNEDEHERGRKILNDYIEAGLKLRAEEEIYDLPMSKDSASDEGTAWDAWDATYGPYFAASRSPSDLPGKTRFPHGPTVSRSHTAMSCD
ncbi:hypothetical protein ABVK25_009957 [Lepraria finkii]|uniref:DUF7580 domain-containing protein n=1 Tax=Lepraria finkii TaxID=1340010 RepID=A0ABR4AW03_9LECA